MTVVKPCPVQTAVSVMGGKWKPGILFRLQKGTFRQLKELEASGVVKRLDYAEVPPKVEYSLTRYGKTLGPLLMTLAVWGQGHIRHLSK
jgi:DNA-binding HxlR family transcriptional regulator